MVADHLEICTYILVVFIDSSDSFVDTIMQISVLYFVSYLLLFLTYIVLVNHELS